MKTATEQARQVIEDWLYSSDGGRMTESQSMKAAAAILERLAEAGLVVVGKELIGEAFEQMPADNANQRECVKRLGEVYRA